MTKKQAPIKVVEINKPTKKEAKGKIDELNQYLSKNWFTPLEKQSNE